MRSFIRALDRDFNHNLLGLPIVGCEFCTPIMLLEMCRDIGAKRREAFGYAFVGQFHAEADQQEFEVPILLGTIDGKEAIRNTKASVPVGDMVCRSLDKEGFKYEWDHKAGSMIHVTVRRTDEGCPEPAEPHGQWSGNVRVQREPLPTPECWDQVAKNPVRLVNIPRHREHHPDYEHYWGSVSPLKPGDVVKLGFCMHDAPSTLAKAVLSGEKDCLRGENMWVEVTKVWSNKGKRHYRGELLNSPVMIDPSKLRAGSPVTFTGEHGYPNRITLNDIPEYAATNKK